MGKRAPLSFTLDRLAPAPAPASVSEPAASDQQPKRKGRQGRQFIAAHVEPEAAKQFKLLSVQEERTTQSMLIEAINDLFAKYGISRIADE